jgi:lauroyl/myristoyl acyltransferase
MIRAWENPPRAVDVTFRHFLSWKPLFYDGLLPLCRALGPAKGDAVLATVGRSLSAAWPPRRKELLEPLERIREALGADWDLPETLAALEENVLRFLARDCTLDGDSDERFFERFDVKGLEHFESAQRSGRGVILVGSHLGGHLSAPHWLYRRNTPLRMLIQRPQHISRLLQSRFDDGTSLHSQRGFFLRRNLTAEEASKRVFRTRAALRDGLIVYLKGDVPWTGPNTRPGRLLGQSLSFQSLWAEFAALFRAPVVTTFCTHLPRGRYALTFDPAWTVTRGGEESAVARYLDRLEREIAAHPSDAVAHLLWPCYGLTRAAVSPLRLQEPSPALAGTPAGAA